MNYEILSNLIIEKVHSVSTMYTETKTNAKRQNRPLWALIIKYEGETYYRSDEKEYISNIDNIAILPKGSNYEWYCKKAGCFSIIEFECKKTCPNIFSFNVKNGDYFLKTIQKMEINRTLKKPTYMLDELRDLYGLISSLIKAVERPYISSDKKQKIAPATEYIAKNYNKHIDNDELASLTGLSTVYFRKLFKEAMGISPMSYIKALKIKKAQKMLQSDFSTITDIAYTLGYNNVYEFSKDFKKHIGISPLVYAKQYRE